MHQNLTTEGNIAPIINGHNNSITIQLLTQKPKKHQPSAFARLPGHQKPRERLEALGVDALGFHELLAILLGTGTSRENVMQRAQRIAKRPDELLAITCPRKMQRVLGVGLVQAHRLVVGFELLRRGRGPDAKKSASGHKL